MAKRGPKSKYSDEKAAIRQEEGVLDTPEHTLHMHGSRKFNPMGGTSNDLGPSLSPLAGFSTGDWSWKPTRNSCFRQNEMPAFLGVPPGAAELYGPRIRN